MYHNIICMYIYIYIKHYTYTHRFLHVTLYRVVMISLRLLAGAPAAPQIIPGRSKAMAKPPQRPRPSKAGHSCHNRYHQFCQGIYMGLYIYKIPDIIN